MIKIEDLVKNNFKRQSEIDLYIKEYKGYNVFFYVKNRKVMQATMISEIPNICNLTLELDTFWNLSQVENVFKSHFKNNKNGG